MFIRIPSALEAEYNRIIDNQTRRTFIKKYTKKKQPVLDDLDQKIIRELQADARQSYLSLGKKLGASEGTIRNRVSAELKKGIIELKAVLNHENLGFDFSCIVGFEIATDQLTAAESVLAESPNIYFLATCTGVFDLMAILVFRDAAELDMFMRQKVAKLPGIKRTQTFVNMRITKKPWINNVNIIKLLESKSAL